MLFASLGQHFFDLKLVAYFRQKGSLSSLGGNSEVHAAFLPKEKQQQYVIVS